MGAPFVLDHVFVFARPGGPEATALAALELTDGGGKTHLGQGTANRCFFFQNAFLELIWVHDEQEARSAAIATTGLWERSQYRQTGACPFGICLRAAGPENSAPPFETWGYRPPYVPTGSEIPVAVAASFAEPLLFLQRPRTSEGPAAAPARESENHANGIRAIRKMHITLTDGATLTPAVREVERLGIVTFTQGPEPLMELVFDEATQGRTADLRPDLPLLLRW
ncbi:hypothetical protein AKJ09_02367 [Labilithrix luteola]|uniref:Glyoxalase-like domain-containing protein n=1 Tax=Labilithrix luteola TaxID=1391654 RepID=A0A0K1PQA7_9BACT|nr:VOC family protein [Labilithrix luteola]AKU95703.1 hypothetical protein AKJ09_02367 [Labilithrix luteola]